MSEAKVLKDSLPPGHSFVPKGDVYITSNCRKMMEARGRSVFIVVDAKKRRIGIGVLTDIHEDVKLMERKTRAERADNLLKKDVAIVKNFQKQIMNQFPRIPLDSLRNVLKIAMQKGKGKVGRTGTLDPQRKAQLAVRAHVRHCETDYDTLLRNGIAKEDARQRVEAKIREVCEAWSVGPQKTRGKPGKTSQSAVRANARALQTTKQVKHDRIGELMKEIKAARQTAADSVDAILRTAKTAGSAMNKTTPTTRHAMRAHRQKRGVTKAVTTKTRPAKQQKPASKPGPKVVPTAASFRERRTPKPRVNQPVAPNPPTRVEGERTSQTMSSLDDEDRARIIRWAARIDNIEHRLLRYCRRRVRRLRTMANLYNQINGILADTVVEKIETSAAARKDLVTRLRRTARAPAEGSS